MAGEQFSDPNREAVGLPPAGIQPDPPVVHKTKAKAKDEEVDDQ